MKKKLYAIQKSVRLVCIWVPTGNSIRPLVCKWIDAAMARDALVVSAETEAGRMRLCA
jgi:hypothetical protein